MTARWKKGTVWLFTDRDVNQEGTSEEFRLNPNTHEVCISQQMDGLGTYDVIITADQVRRLVAELKEHGVDL